jgi:hypothetical protein
MHNETRVCISQVTEMAQYAANNKNALDQLRVVVLGIQGGYIYVKINPCC